MPIKPGSMPDEGRLGPADIGRSGWLCRCFNWPGVERDVCGVVVVTETVNLEGRETGGE